MLALWHFFLDFGAAGTLPLTIVEALLSRVVALCYRSDWRMLNNMKIVWKGDLGSRYINTALGEKQGVRKLSTAKSFSRKSSSCF